jgi:pyruvate dehydrogenase E2 component (dihydrolipoamide acetyltransferase)
MAEFFLMPQASPTMEAGTILSWKKAEGAVLSPSDVLAEVETDKAAMEIEIFDKAVLLKILVAAGESAPAGQPIAIIGKSIGEDYSALLASLSAGAPPAAAPAPVVAPAPATVVAPAPVTVTATGGSSPAAPPIAPKGASAPSRTSPPTWAGRPLIHGIMEQHLFEPGSDVSGSAEGRVRAAPAARRAAHELGVDLANVQGTGPRGRVVRADVEAAARPTAPPLTTAPAAPPAFELVRNSQMRKTIAKRLRVAWQEAPAFFLSARLDCDRLVSFREQLVGAGLKVSYNDLLIKACARALREVPEVNASWGEEAITRHAAVHIGVAVALPDGLITPVIRNADQKGVARIADEMRDLAGRARERKLQPDEYTGSTFSISNLGMMGIEHFTAILNPPEALILAAGSLQREPVVDASGALTTGWRMKVTLTCDHRVVDGALGARFLQVVRRYIENPALLAA